MTEFARLTIGIDSGPAKTGAAEVVRALDDIKKAAQQHSGVISNAAVGSEKLGEQLLRTGTAATTGGAGQITLENATRKSFSAALESQHGWRRLENVLTSTGIEAIGLEGRMGLLAERLGGFAIGGPITLAVVAGIALMVISWRHFTEASRAAEKAIEDVLAAGDKLRAAQRDPAATNQDDLGKARVQLQAAQEKEAFLAKQLDDFRAATAKASAANPNINFAGADDRRVDALVKQTALVTRLATIVNLQSAEQIRLIDEEIQKREQAEDKEFADVKRLAAERQRAAEERHQSLATIRTLELQLAIETATNLADELAARRALADFIATEANRSANGLTDAEQSKVALLRDQLQTIKDQATEADRLAKAERDRLDQLTKFMTQNKALLGALTAGGQALQDRAFGKPQTVGPAPGSAENLEANTQARLDAVKALTDEQDRLAQALTDTLFGTIDATKGLVSFGASLGVLDDQSARAADAMLQGFGQLATGDSLGAALYGLTALASILGGVGQAAAQAAAKARQARLDFERALEDFGTIGQSSFAKARVDLKRQFDDLVRQAAGAAGLSTLGKTTADLEAQANSARGRPHSDRQTDFLAELDRLRPLLKAQEEELARQAKVALQQTAADFRVRELIAQGRDVEATALQDQLRAEKEINDLRAKFGDLLDEETIARYRGIQAMEAEKRAREEAERLARERRDLGSDFASRRQRATGDTLGADITAVRGNADRERDRITDLFTKGVIDQAKFDAWLALIRDETTGAIDTLTDAYNAQIAAVAKLNTLFIEDLGVRNLVAQGLDAEAAARRQQLADEREIADARARGITEAGIAALIYTQGLEAEGRARVALLAAQKAAIALLQEETRARDDLVVRSLRARGFGGAADAIALTNRQKQERDDAITKGFSAAYIADLLRTQAEERKAQRDAVQQQQQQAFGAAEDANFGLSTPNFLSSKPELNLAVGAADSTVNRLAGYAASQLAVQTEHLSVSRLALAQLIRIAAKNGGATVDDIDQALGLAAGTTDRNAGLQSSNR